MGKLTLYSVQNKKILNRIINGDYKPSFSLSKGAYDVEGISGYKYMLDALSLKTGVDYLFGVDSCVWAWYQNPYFANHINIIDNVNDLVVITFTIDDSQVVLSDFDAWNSMFIDGKWVNSVLDLNAVKSSETIQAVLWKIEPDSILSVEPLLDHVLRYNEVVGKRG